MKKQLILALIFIPLVEICTIIQVGHWIGLWNTLLLIFFTGFTGVYMIRTQGKALFFQFIFQLRKKEFLNNDFLFKLLYLIAGVFLISPGIFTDFLGFLLLIPKLRQVLSKLLKKFLIRQLNSNHIHIKTYKNSNENDNNGGNSNYRSVWTLYGFNFLNQKEKTKSPPDPYKNSYTKNKKPSPLIADVIDLSTRQKKEFKD